MPQIKVCDHKASVLLRTVLGAGLAAAVVCANTAARAGDDDDGPTMLGTILQGIGLQGPHSSYAGIDYNERSPLVVPPTRELPAPQTANAAPAPDWPKDQDMARRAKAKAESKKVTPHGDYQSESSRPLRPDEYNQLNRPKPSAAGDGDSSADQLMRDPRDHGVTGTAKNLFGSMFSKKNEYATFTGEPSRETLTDPPPGYLTPSPDQPYGVGQAPAQYKVKSVGERVEPTR